MARLRAYDEGEKHHAETAPVKGRTQAQAKMPGRRMENERVDMSVRSDN
jgi:hypothetical protein